MTIEEVCKYCSDAYKNRCNDKYIDYHSCNHEESYYLVYDHTEFLKTETHTFISAKKIIITENRLIPELIWKFFSLST